jgi:hypothetical protein
MDVIEKLISRDRARKIYGVAIDEGGNVDQQETLRLRAG